MGGTGVEVKLPLDGIKNTNLEQIWLSKDRYPALRVEIWNPRKAKVQDVVLGRWRGFSLDISDFVERVQIQQNQVFENNDDAVSTRATIDIVYDNVGIEVGDTRIPITEKLFRDGTTVRIYEGDRRIARQDWPVIFTGVCRGFPSGDIAKRDKRIIRCAAFGRAQSFQKQIIVGTNWEYDTDLGDMAVDIAMLEMGLQREEIRFGQFGLTTKHKANALTEIGKIQGLNEIMKHVGRKPYFDARGFLVSHDTSFDKPPVHIFDRSPVIVSISRAQNPNSTVNSVEVIGLNSVQKKVVHPSQPLAEVNATVGYFDSSFSENVYFSDDRTRRAENTFAVIVHGGSRIFGLSTGDVSWSPIDEFSGKVQINTKYAPYIIGYFIYTFVFLYALLIVSEASNNTFMANFARILIAGTMMAILFTLSKIGRFRIVIWGETFEYVFEELRSISVLKNTSVADIAERSETMHFLSNIEDVKNRSRDLLRRELVKGMQYRIVMLSDPILEVDDIISIREPAFGLDTFHDFYIISIGKSYQRGTNNPGTMEITAWLSKVETP